MKKNKNTYITIGSIIIALGLIFFGLYISRCHGDVCFVDKSEIDIVKKVDNTENIELFPKMIPDLIKEKVLNKEIILLDVREDSEWQEGHIKGALHISLGNLNINTTKNLSKNIPMYIYCRSGKRANEAESKLKALGFEKAENLGGIIYWQGRGGELVK